jgi:hypothetical protein
LSAASPTLPFYLTPSVLSKGDNWLDIRHPYWLKNNAKWRYARDVYTGEVLDAEKISDYLIRKGTGETEQAFNERRALADFTSHFGLCADALAGMLFHVEDDATRLFGDLGTDDDPASVMGKLYRDADGQKTGYATLWKQLGIELVITHRHWVQVDIVQGAARILLWEPERVVDWIEDETGYAMVRICENVDTRTKLEHEPGSIKQYLVITRGGWQRYREVKKANKTVAVLFGPPGTHRYEDAAGHLQLPIFPVELPLRRNVGFPLAKKNVAIFNKESERDHLLRAANFPKFLIVGDETVFRSVSAEVQKGAFGIPDDPNTSKSHQFIAPPTTSIEIATKVLDQKVEQFYKTFFREYSHTAQEKTATEVRQDTASGVGAFLQMLKAGLDDAENETLWRLEQAVYPNDRTKWHKARVERDDNFQPLNVDEEIERLRIRYFGQTTAVPISREARIEVLRQIAAWDGMPFNKESAGTAVDGFELQETVDYLDKQQLPIPAAARAEIVVRWLKRLGITNPTFQAEAQRLAAEADATRNMLAQPPGPPPAQPGDTAPPAPAKTKQIKSDGNGGFVITEGP